MRARLCIVICFASGCVVVDGSDREADRDIKGYIRVSRMLSEAGRGCDTGCGCDAAREGAVEPNSDNRQQDENATLSSVPTEFDIESPDPARLPILQSETQSSSDISVGP